jgi:hypothetical protein
VTLLLICFPNPTLRQTIQGTSHVSHNNIAAVHSFNRCSFDFEEPMIDKEIWDEALDFTDTLMTPSSDPPGLDASEVIDDALVTANLLLAIWIVYRVVAVPPTW